MFVVPPLDGKAASISKKLHIASSLTRFEVAPFRRPDLANTAIAGASDAEIAYFHVARLHQNHSCLRRSGSGRVLDPAYCATSKLTRRVTIVRTDSG